MTNNNPNIIGITGTFCAGKDTAADFFIKKGFAHLSLSDIVRDESDARGLPQDRDTLRNLANELRRDFGLAVLAERAMKKIESEKLTAVVITSIRSAEEAAQLKKFPNFKLIAVDAPIEMRYLRAKIRGRDSDFVDFDTFRQQEEMEMAGGAGKQNIASVISLADHHVANDATVEDFFEKLEGSNQ